MYLVEKMKAKLHNGVVTEANLYYEGSVTIGKDLLDASGFEPFDKVQVLNITNGNRIETYVIEGKGSEICLNGAAAHQFNPGDRVIIIGYMMVMKGDLEYSRFIGKIYSKEDDPSPRIVILEGNNEIKEIK